MKLEYDVIVVGAGHAGCEAAMAAANLGSKVLLITMNLRTIGQMSCNPAMGGIAKGQIVREIDALGGYSGIISDKTAIQFKMLNKSKGPAMWSPRTQNDRMLFAQEWRNTLEKNPNISFWQGMATNFLLEKNRVYGIVTELGIEFHAKSVILTNGTFLDAVLHVGACQTKGGRVAESQAVGISEVLRSFGFETGRLKTGTPPRIDSRSIDLSKLPVHPGDKNPEKFSFSSETSHIKKQLDCWVVHTNSTVHEILASGFHTEPAAQGSLTGRPPRYCPSIEDKVRRFAEKERHQLFIEPEGWNTIEMYLNGFATSLEYSYQYKALRNIVGFENVAIISPGYCVEYDFFAPTQLKKTLETKSIEALFFAGQINGTTGYEEAACQGLMAGINAHQKAQEKAPFIINRNEAYIGVLIDDLVTKGTEEPYRMFTSRAEFRTLLRQDNADIRLTEKSHKIGLASNKRMRNLERKKEDTKNILSTLGKIKISPESVNTYFSEIGSAKISEKTQVEKLISRPHVSLEKLVSQNPSIFQEYEAFKNKSSLQQAEIEVKYRSYLKKEQEAAVNFSNLEHFFIPEYVEYGSIQTVSIEARQKLDTIKPNTLGQAARISGVSPADIFAVRVYLEKRKEKKRKSKKTL